MKKHWKTILVIIAFVLLFTIHIRDTIAINNIEDWLATNYSYQKSLNANSAKRNDAEDLKNRVSQLERRADVVDDAMRIVYGYLGL